MTCCSHTPTKLQTKPDVDQRCDACSLGMAQPTPSQHRFTDAVTQAAHDKEAGVNA